jgi:hypothetical protein
MWQKRIVRFAVAALSGTLVLFGTAFAQQPQSLPPEPQAISVPANAPPTIDARPWPRRYTVDATEFSLYRPQLDSWTDNKLAARAVMAVKTGTEKDKDGKDVDRMTYGVLWLSARTETDTEAREIVLTDVKVDRANFPAAKAKEADYLAAARKATPVTNLVVSLDQAEAAMALLDLGGRPQSVPVNNTPPEIIFSQEPAALVLIDGSPVWKPSSVSGVNRVVNTRALLLTHGGKYYFGYGGHWATASALEGPWAATTNVDAALNQVMEKAVSTNEQPAVKDIPANIASQFEGGKFPKVIIRSHPSELIVTDGEPRFVAIPGTQLNFVDNTPADVFIDTSNNNWFVLISGRWFTGPSDKGPWTYVAQASLPADFAKIPSESPKSAVLASVANTPEAKETMIANSIPQTATIDKTQATFTAQYDGAPKMQPIQGTQLSYISNTATPIIRVANGSLYALSNGIWFRASAPNGPWTVAESVPPEIYAIPASSPLHYVTYVKIYGVDGNSISIGYTPGYYGTVASDGVVVYGTGATCNAWIGNVWYGCPATYGYGAAIAYGVAAGWSYGYGWGYYDPWYYPYWGPYYGYWPGYWYPWGYGGAIAGNIYGSWGNGVYSGTAAAWANPWTGNYGRAGAGGYQNTRTGGRGYGYAGRNTNIYTGGTVGAAGGVRYNPETGRVVGGQGASAGNIYTGNAVAGGSRTVVNTDTGRVTRETGGAVRTDQGATVGGRFDSTGAAGDVSGGGVVHYDRETGDVTRGGVADVNGDIYAGKDGNIYKRADGGWEQVGTDGQFKRTDRADQSLNQERAARDRGMERDAAAGKNFDRSTTNRSFDRGSYGGGYRGSMGGYRGGGFRGGGGGFRGGGRRG